MEFALSVNEDLAQFLRLFNYPCGVFLTHACERCHHLFGFAFADGADGAGILRVGVFDKVEAVVAVLGIEGVSGAYVLELYGAADVAGRKLANLFTLCAAAYEDLSHAFLGTAVGIGEFVAFAEHTAHHLEVLHFADVGLDAGLEEINAGGCVLNGSHLHATGVVNLGHFVDEGHHVAEELHQTAYAHVLAGADAEYGEDAAGDHTLADAFAHLVFSEVLGFEELLHEVLVVFSGSLHECLVHLFGLVVLIGRDFLHGVVTSVGAPCEFLHEDDVDDAVEVGTCGYGILYGYHLRTVDGLEVVEHLVVVAVLGVELVDEEDDGLAELFGIAEMVLRADFRTEVAVEQQYGGVGDIEGSDGGADKVVGTRTVDDIEFLALPFHVECGGEDAVAIFLLYGEVVGYRVLHGDAAAALDGTGMEQKGFGEGGLTGTVVAKKGNVLDVV